MEYYQIETWWSDEVYTYTLQALTDEIIEIKQDRVSVKRPELKHGCEIIYNQIPEQRE